MIGNILKKTDIIFYLKVLNLVYLILISGFTFVSYSSYRQLYSQLNKMPQNSTMLCILCITMYEGMHHLQNTSSETFLSRVSSLYFTCYKH